MGRIIFKRETEKELNKIYSRVSQNVCFDRMINTTLLVVGAGAIGPAVEQLVRLGIKRVYLFDNKPVQRKNLVAQNFCYSDKGTPKTEALKKRLHECQFEKNNPEIPPLEVFTYGDFLDVTDSEIKQIIAKEKSDGRLVIMVMASDYHPVQARGNRIALENEIPIFWVGIYGMGKAGEIIFYVPGFDLPCYRCITETRYRFFDKNRLINRLRGDSSGSGKSSGLPMAASFIDAVLAHLIIGYIHFETETNQHGRLFHKLLVEKRNFIQCQLDPEYMLNDSENIFFQIQGPDLIAFNTLFQQESRKTDCIDCRDFAINSVWKNTDYTKENYRKALETFSMRESKLSHKSDYVHPLLNEYNELFPQWEKDQLSTAFKTEEGSEIIIEKTGTRVGTVPLENVIGKESIRNIKPGHYMIRLDNGRIIWQDELSEQELIWTAAFPGEALNLAADTGGITPRMTREIKLLDGDLIIRVYPEIESGRIEIEIKGSDID
ncbi:ThiF family adenylyltransferase [Thermodesulfobacteriota bacterium]